MAFQKPKKQPQFADLIGILAQTKGKTEPQLYQTVQEIINRLTQFQAVTLNEVADINNSVNNSQSSIAIIADKYASYLTALPEEVRLPNSNQLLAGIGITIDYSTPNRALISTDGDGLAGKYYDAPLTDGLVPNTELIFGLGECIIVQVPNV